MSPRRVVGLGESLLRLSTPGHERIGQAGELAVHVGGAEMNALIGLAHLGMDTTWLTRLADNPLGQRIAAHAREHGVAPVVDWDPDARAPLYFVEHGVTPRPSEVLYDREHTAMRSLSEDTFDWAAQLESAAAALSCGITCALGAGPSRAVVAFLSQARFSGVRTVFDVNHRSRMWSWSQALPVLRDVVGHVDVLLASDHDLTRLLDREGDRIGLARRAIDRYGTSLVLLRETSQIGDGRVRVAATAVTADEVWDSNPYEAVVVDAFGAGDAALAVLVAGLVDGRELAEVVDDTAWVAAFHHTVPGDAWQTRPADLAHRRTPGRRILR